MLLLLAVPVVWVAIVIIPSVVLVLVVLFHGTRPAGQAVAQSAAALFAAAATRKTAMPARPRSAQHCSAKRRAHHAEQY